MKNQGIQLLIVCLIAFSCKTADMVSKKHRSAELHNAKYEVVSLQKTDLNEHTITLNLDVEENTINGNASCNDYRFEFKMKDKEISMKPGIATKMYCEDKMKTENSFMKLMSQVKYIAQSDENLYLKNSENQLLIKAKKTKKS